MDRKKRQNELEELVNELIEMKRNGYNIRIERADDGLRSHELYEILHKKATEYSTQARKSFWWNCFGAFWRAFEFYFSFGIFILFGCSGTWY